MKTESRPTTASPRLLGILGFAAGLLVLVVLCGMVLWPHTRSAGASSVGGPFALITQDGTTVTQDVLIGQPTLVFFGYTHCPDVCPATLSQISSVFKTIGAGNKAKALFITVDPRRDTPVVMKDYLASFDPRIVGLTGAPEAVKQVEAAYKVYARAVPDQDGTYTMDHTAITYLMDKDGRFVGAFNLDRPAKDAADELRSYF